MIEISGLCKSFDKEVLKDVNLTIEDNSIFGLVGINGAGKSTLLRLLSGVYNKDAGSIKFDGEEVYENEKIKKDIFFLPDDPYYDRSTTPLSLIELYKAFYDIDEKAYLEYINNFKLPLKTTMKNFSKGMKRQVFVSLALAIKPKYLLLDEAFDGLDPLARLSLKRTLMKIQEERKMTVIISSHSLRELEDICDSFGLLDDKRITSSGNINQSINRLHKYQIAFDTIPEKKMFDGINFISYKQDKRVITVVLEDEYDSVFEKFKKFNPLIIDEIAIDFEELFIIEVEKRGYLKND